MAKINYVNITRSIARSNKGWARINTICERKYNEAKKEMLVEFSELNITQELSAGSRDPDGASNISGTLGGKGNLFSFIGFSRGSDPATQLKASLDKNITLTPPRLTPEFDRIKVQFRIKVNKAAIQSDTPLPFETGNSWAFAIEKGISGFSRFLSGYFKASRSGGGIQTRHTIRSAEFQTRPYLSSLLKRMVTKIMSK